MSLSVIIASSVCAYLVFWSRRTRPLVTWTWDILERTFQREEFLPFYLLLMPLIVIGVPALCLYAILHLLGAVG